MGVSESLDPIAGCKRPRCRGAGPGSGTATARLDSWPAEGTDPEKRGLLRRVGGQPGSSRAGVGRGLGADRRTDRQGHAGTRAPQRRRGRRGEGPRSETPPPPGPGRGPGRRAGSGCSRGLLAGNPGPCACPHLKAQAPCAPALKGVGSPPPPSSQRRAPSTTYHGVAQELLGIRISLKKDRQRH